MSDAVKTNLAAFGVPSIIPPAYRDRYTAIIGVVYARMDEFPGVLPLHLMLAERAVTYYFLIRLGEEGLIHQEEKRLTVIKTLAFYNRAFRDACVELFRSLRNEKEEINHLLEIIQNAVEETVTDPAVRRELGVKLAKAATRK